jgi:UDP-N-acetylmuramyl pentapeptide phosphotransferase/UDP-N-acetylglucosamine-1-phosphate transferase
MVQKQYFKITKEWQPPKPMSKPVLIFHKMTHILPGEGKRLFRMTPIHHHFEAIAAEHGRGEVDVVKGFWVAQFALCTVVLAAWFQCH